MPGTVSRGGAHARGFTGSMPLALTGTRLALNVALLTTVVVELVASQDELVLWWARETLHTEELYA